jgi:hypothetical protein
MIDNIMKFDDNEKKRFKNDENDKKYFIFTIYNSTKNFDLLNILLNRFLERITNDEHIKYINTMINDINQNIEYLKLIEFFFEYNLFFIDYNYNMFLNIVNERSDILKKLFENDDKYLFIRKLSDNFEYPPKKFINLLEIFHKNSQNDIKNNLFTLLYFLIDFQQSLKVKFDVDIINNFINKFNIPKGWQELIFGFWLLDSQIHDYQLIDKNLNYLISYNLPNHKLKENIL